MSNGSDAMADVYAKLDWAEKHLADLMVLAREYLRPGGGDDRPFGIEFDDRRPPVVVAKFMVESPVPYRYGGSALGRPPVSLVRVQTLFASASPGRGI